MTRQTTTTVTCDRCGTEGKLDPLTTTHGERPWTDIDLPPFEYDLCPTCSLELDAWVNNREDPTVRGPRMEDRPTMSNRTRLTPTP